jgi:hypothetical protein
MNFAPVLQGAVPANHPFLKLVRGIPDKFAKGPRTQFSFAVPRATLA